MRVSIAFVLVVAACSPSVPEPANEEAATATATSAAEPTTAPAPPTTSAPAKTLSVACTKKGCKSELELTLKWDKNTLTKGRYSFVVEADGKTGRCDTTFPPKECTSDALPKCSGEVAFTVEQICSPLPDGHKILAIMAVTLADAPAQLSLTVSRDGKQIGKYQTQPKYETLRPNGAECPPVCNRASEEACIGPCKQ